MKLHLTGLLVLLLIGSAPLTEVFAQERVTQLKGPKNATSQYSGAVYGPIDSSDTLWRIASRYRQNPNLSVYQVMVAIYELNPDAFEQNNLNLLVDGATLQLPSERYIARIDVDKARQRAEQDDDQFARMQGQPGQSLNNIKPPVPLVNQDDLSNTKSAIEQQITRLDSQQTEKFDELRQQFAASLDNVQVLVDENRKLAQRVEQVNDDLTNLRGQLEGDVQAQMDEQLTLQRQLLDMIKQEQAERQTQQDSSLINTLSSPVSLIIGSGLLTMALLGGLGYWLLSRRKSPSQEPLTEVSEAPVKAAANNDVDDFATALGGQGVDDDELSDDELFNDNDLLDDVLSSELEEALDDELENFAELSDDDMLVPEDDQDELGDDFESGSLELDQDELDNLFDSDDLTDPAINSDDDDELSGFDLSSNDDIALEEEPATEPEPSALDDSQTELDEEAQSAADFEAQDTAGDDADVTGEQAATEPAPEPQETVAAAEPLASVDDDDDTPEISIDELLNEPEKSTLADTLGMDDDTVNEEMLERLDEEIHQQNQELDRLTDNIINEIEQLEMMGGMMPDEEDDDEVVVQDSSPSPQAIQDLEAVAGDLDEIDIEDMANADEFNDPLSDELIAELQAQDTFPADDSDADTPEILDTFEQEHQAGESQPPEDALSDELLAELTAEEEQEHDKLDALSDELLAELEAEDTGMDLDETPPADSEPHDEPEPETQSEPGTETDTEAEPEPQHEEQQEPELQTESSAPEEQEAEAGLDEPEAEAQSDQHTSEAEDVAETEQHTEAEAQLSAETDDAPELSGEGDALDDALKAFDEQMMDDIPSLAGEGSEQTDAADSNEFDDDLLNDVFDESALDSDDTEGSIDDFALEQEVDGIERSEPAPEPETEQEFDELEDVPGLDDWLSGSKESEDDAILDELENSEFDDLLEAIDSEPEPQKEQASLTLDNPDLDLEALLNDDSGQAEAADTTSDDKPDYVDVETLMNDSAESESFEETPLDLDVSLSEFTGIGEDDDLIDIDKDAGQSANLDLARVYIEMDDITAARELLEEVVEKGSTEHREEASRLLEQLQEAQ